MTKEYQRRGLRVKQSKIERHLLDKSVADMVNKHNRVEERLVFADRSKRQAVFDKNY